MGVAEHSDDSGLCDADLATAEKTLESLATECDCSVTLLRRRTVTPQGKLSTSDWLVRQKVEINFLHFYKNRVYE